MSDYWLPCTCGARTAVSASQAGQAVRCACGEALEVPTLRGLRELAATDSHTPRAHITNRHQAAFSLLLVGLLASGVAGYLAWTLPPPIILPTPQQFDMAIEQGIEQGTVEQVYGAYQELKKGLAKTPLKMMPDDESAMHRRQWMVWGLEASLVIAVVSLVGAAVAMPWRGSPRPSHPSNGSGENA